MDILEIGNKIKKTEKGLISTLMGKDMKVIGWKTKKMEKDFIYIEIKIPTMVTGRMIEDKGKGLWNTIMIQCIQEIGWKESNKEEADLFSLVMIVIKENGSLEKCMAEAHMLNQMVVENKAFGSMGNWFRNISDKFNVQINYAKIIITDYFLLLWSYFIRTIS